MVVGECSIHGSLGLLVSADIGRPIGETLHRTKGHMVVS